jgi:hypothetical protein
MGRNRIEADADVLAALAWLASVTGDAPAFHARLARAQDAYRQFTESVADRGKDPKIPDLGPDLVAAVLAQAQSLLNDRRTYDIALGSKTVPWLKQLGRNIQWLDQVAGARDRAARMLSAHTVAPDSAIFELVMASNYAADGLGVAFIDEAKGQARTPDLRLSSPELDVPFFVECKRLDRGQYEQAEQARQRQLFRKVAALIDSRRLSVHIDVTYTRELAEVPETYLADHLQRALSSPIVTLSGHPWKDDFGHGQISPANLAAVRADTRQSSLYFGTKLARLLSGQVVRETGYSLAAGADPDHRDPRFIDTIHWGSVVTWQCIATGAIERKSRFVKSKLAEADRQLQGWGPAIVHLAMDTELQCESSDLRRARNIDTIKAFTPKARLMAIYVHYLVPRISEGHSWLIDETVDTFSPLSEGLAPARIFTAAESLGNDLPAWKQLLAPHLTKRP